MTNVAQANRKFGTVATISWRWGDSSESKNWGNNYFWRVSVDGVIPPLLNEVMVFAGELWPAYPVRDTASGMRNGFYVFVFGLESS